MTSTVSGDLTPSLYEFHVALHSTDIVSAIIFDTDKCFDEYGKKKASKIAYNSVTQCDNVELLW